MSAFVEEFAPVVDIELMPFFEMATPPEDPEPPKRGRGRPRIEDPSHFIKYRTQYYRDNASKWNEYQKNYIKEKRRQQKVEKCLKFISEQVYKK
jgi:hypothetical protein